MAAKKNTKIMVKKKKFGNSILAINYRFWTCHYCGNLIKNNVWFVVANLEGLLDSHVWCSKTCMDIMLLKIGKIHIESDRIMKRE